VNALRFALRMLVRDARSGELTVLMLALLVAVTALTAVGLFTNRVSLAIRAQAGEVLAADLRLESPRPFAPDGASEREAKRMGLDLTRTLSFSSVIFNGEANSLVSVHAVAPGYPLRGALRVAERPFGAAVTSRDIPALGEVWPESRLLARLGLNVGDELAVGASRLKVTRVLDYRPDQGSGFADLAPTVLMRYEDVPATRLVQGGSRAHWALLFRGAAAPIAEFEAWLREHREPGSRIIDVGESSEQMRSATARAQRFLRLSALITVLLAAVAVAMAARRHSARHLDQVALMKCLGAEQRFVLTVSVTELFLAALAGTAAGVTLAYLAQALLVYLVRGLVKGTLPPPDSTAAWLGLGTALAIMIGFALPPLLELRRTPPARVLRRDLGPPHLSSTVSGGLALLALLALLFWLVDDVRLVAYLAAGVLATSLALYLAGLGLVRLTRGIRGGAGAAWRYGLANVARRGRESAVQVVAFGLGLTVLLLLVVVRNDVLDAWRASVPSDAPNEFLINIPPADTDRLAHILQQGGVAPPRFFPWVRARLVAIDGRPAESLVVKSDRARGFLEREQNLSWSADLPADNQLIAGQWWSGQPTQPQVSVASEFAEALGIQVGDRLAFDVAGERLEAQVGSIRRVRWDGFRPNFFLVFSPGALDSSTGTYMTSVHMTAAQRPLLAQVVREFPSITAVDVDAILEQIRSVVDRAARAVQYVFLFTLAAGVVVLLAAIQATRDERRYESAVLRTLGASRATVLKGIAAEFVALGLLAGVLAAVAASVAEYEIATRLFSLHYSFDGRVWLVGLLVGAALVGISGTLATRSVVTTPPATTLNQGG
jgi:putative ABC transport system permease protein